MSRYKISEGIFLKKNDIIELEAQSQAIAEFDDGTILGLGPETRIMILTSQGKASTNLDIFLLAGQLKLSTTNTARYKFSSPLLSSVILKDGILVLRQDANMAMIFVEKGESASILTEPKGNPYTLRNSGLYVAKQGQKAEVLPRPSADFVDGLPKMFLDNLPSRKEKFKSGGGQPKKMGDFNYNDVESWLKTSPEIRKVLVQKWRAKASDPIFRKVLIDNLKFHPEWDRVLFPEKYKGSQSDKNTEDSIWKRLNY